MLKARRRDPCPAKIHSATCPWWRLCAFWRGPQGIAGLTAAVVFVIHPVESPLVALSHQIQNAVGAGSLWVAACGSEGSPAIVNGAIVSPGLPIGANEACICKVSCPRDTLFRLPRSQARPSSTALRKEARDSESRSALSPNRRRPAHRSETCMMPCSRYYLHSLSWTSRTFYFPDSRDLLEVLGGLSRQRERGGSLGDPPGP